MQLTELTGTLAPLARTTPDALRIRMQRLYAIPELAALGMAGRRAGHTDRGLRATNVTAGMLAVTAMLAGKPETIGERVLRVWRARSADIGDACPVTGAASFGEAITALLGDPALADRLDYIEIARESEIARLAWMHRRHDPSVFHPDGGRGYRRAVVARLDTPRLDQITQLPGEAMRIVAARLAADEGTA